MLGEENLIDNIIELFDKETQNQYYSGDYVKKLIFVFVFMMMVLGLCAQTGLLGLYYGEYFPTAKSNLESKGFVWFKNWPVAKEFGLEYPETYYQVTLYVNPNTERIVGWSIWYKEDLSDAVYKEIMDGYVALHGKDFTVSEEDRMLHWQLDSSKTCSLAWNEDGVLKLAVYYDVNNSDIIDRKDEKPRPRN